MRWRSRRRSTNIEDRRGRSVGRAGRRSTKVGGGFIVVALLAFLFLGEDAGSLISMLGGAQQTQRQPAPPSPPAGGQSDELADFVSVVLATTEDVWGQAFSAAGQRYRPPRLVLFSDAVQSACGFSSSATGPFYCPGDNQVYLDLSFLGDLRRFGASGDFAFAYVIAHEVGHHIQSLLGTERQVRSMQRQYGGTQAKALSVRMELQADCYAGVWANRANADGTLLEEGDIEEGLNAAASIGDDRLQKMAGRRVQPEAFTHGSSAQRVAWFKRGYQTGDPNACDTFGSRD